ncbi:hypothetical protein Tco_1119554, partial [Tanacetum coccineum]
APSSLDYVPGPEEPEQAPHLPEFVSEPVYPEFMPPEDEVLPAEEQPLHAAASPTADSPDYVPESDPKEDPKEDDDEDPEKDPADYPADGGDDGNDEDDSSNDDKDDDVDIKGDEEEEHPAPADSIAVALLVVDHAPSTEETRPFEADALPPSLPPNTIPLPSITTTYLLISTTCCPIRLVGPDAPSSGTPPLHLLSTDHRADRPEVTLPPSKGLGIALDARHMMIDMPGAQENDGTQELGRRMTKFTTRVRQYIDEIYKRLDDEQTEGYVITYSGGSTAGSDYRVTGSRIRQEIGRPIEIASSGPSREQHSSLRH